MFRLAQRYRPIGHAAGLLALLLGLSLLSAHLHAAEKPLPQLTVAYPFDEGSQQQRALAHFAESLYKAQIARVVAIPAAKLGDAPDALIRGTQKGDTDLAIVPFETIAKLEPAFSAFTTPFLFEDYRHLGAVQSGTVGQKLLGDLHQYGMEGVGWWAGEFLGFAGNSPAVSPDDVNGKSITFSPSNGSRQPRPTATHSLEQFLDIKVDALPSLPAEQRIFEDTGDLLEASPEQFSRLAKSPKFITLTHHINDGYVVVANPNSWNKLGPERQEFIRQAFNTARKLSYDEFRAAEDSLRRKGPGDAAVISWTQADRDDWIAKTRAFDVASVKLSEQFIETVRSYPVTQLVSGEAPRARISWNSWIEDDQGRQARAIKVGKTAALRLDLARQPYMRRMSSPPDGALASRLAKLVTGQTLTLLVQPVLLGTNLIVAPGGELRPLTLTVNGSKAKPSANDQDKVDAFWDGKLTVQAISKALTLSGSVQWPVKGSQSGCADVAFVVWDAARTIPLDNIVISVPVENPNGGEVVCYGRQNASDMASGLETLLSGPNSTSTQADVALHVFEFDDGGGSSRSVAVLVHRKRLEAATRNPGLRDTGIYAWELVSVLSEYVSSSSQLPKLILKAHENLSNNVPHPYEDVASDMSMVLFSGKTASDKEMAGKAREALKDAVEGSNPAHMLMRLVDKGGQQIYLPVGLLAAGSAKPVVARSFSVIQTLAGPSSGAPSCIGSWHVARSPQLQGAEGDVLKLLTEAPTRLAESAELLSSHQAVAGYVGSQPSDSRGEGFLVLAHHDEGTLRFAKDDRPPPWIRSDYINRTFPPGSFALLAACSTSGSSEQTSAIVNRLASQGVSSMVLSPFPVDLEYGVRLELAFENEALREAAHPTGATAATLLERSVADVAAAFPKESGMQEMALEFQLVGNPDIKVCEPSRK